MRKALFATLIAFAAVSAFADCPQPSAMLATIPGTMSAPCTGSFGYSTVNLTATNTSSNTGSGAGAGKTITSISVTRPMDSTSPALMSACLTGKHMQSGSVRLDASTLVKLTDVTVSSWSASGGGGNVTENFSLNFTKIEVDYGSGSGGGTRTSYLGGARASGMMAVMVGGTGGSPGEISPGAPPDPVSITAIMPAARAPPMYDVLPPLPPLPLP